MPESTHGSTITHISILQFSFWIGHWCICNSRNLKLYNLSIKVAQESICIWWVVLGHLEMRKEELVVQDIWWLLWQTALEWPCNLPAYSLFPPECSATVASVKVDMWFRSYLGHLSRQPFAIGCLKEYLLVFKALKELSTHLLPCHRLCRTLLLSRGLVGMQDFVLL